PIERENWRRRPEEHALGKNGNISSALNRKSATHPISRLRIRFQIRLLAAKPNLKLTRFQQPLAVIVNKRHLLGGEGKLDGLLFAGRQPNTAKSLQLKLRHRQRGLHIFQVKLDDLITETLPRVFDVYLN